MTAAEKDKALAVRDAGGTGEELTVPDEFFEHFSAESAWYPITLVGRNLLAHGPFWTTLALCLPALHLLVYLLFSLGSIALGQAVRATIWPAVVLISVVAARGARRTLGTRHCTTVLDTVREAPGRIVATTAILLASSYGLIHALHVLKTLGSLPLLLGLFGGSWIILHLLGELTLAEDGILQAVPRALRRAATRLLPPWNRPDKPWLQLLTSLAFWWAVLSFGSLLQAHALSGEAFWWQPVDVLLRCMAWTVMQGAIVGAVFNWTHLYVAWDMAERRALVGREASLEIEDGSP